MKNLQNFIITVLFCLSAVSCKKDIAKYNNDPRINFFERTNDQYQRVILSKSFSFAAEPATVLTDTILVRAKIMGLAAANDRKFGAISLSAQSTAIPGTDYKILEGTVKANELFGYLPVVLYRTAELKTISKVLVLQTADIADFKTGVINENVFTLNWNDNLVKPANWDTRPGLVTYFGVYSLTKFQFISTVLGRVDFPIQTGAYDPALLTHYQMLDLKAKLKDALGVYNSTHSALTDEFGLVVTFP
jgi:hypothetical protein